MNLSPVTMVRAYFNEGEPELAKVVNFLHNEAGVRGVTLFRGISGFGESGKIHTAQLLDLAAELPIIVEFFDEPDKITFALDQLTDLLEPGHIVCWQGVANINSNQVES